MTLLELADQFEEAIKLFNDLTGISIPMINTTKSTELTQEALDIAAAAERASIVAWLRDPVGKGSEGGVDFAIDFAEAIEQGRHLQKPVEQPGCAWLGTGCTWRYIGTDYHGSHKGEDSYECTKCGKRERRIND